MTICTIILSGIVISGLLVVGLMYALSAIMPTLLDEDIEDHKK